MVAGRCPCWWQYTPEFAIERPRGTNVGGSTTFDGRLIKTSPWILHNIEESISVLRHETAHRLVAPAKLPGNTKQVLNFDMVLAAVSDTADNDRYWWPRTEIEMARRQMHPEGASEPNGILGIRKYSHEEH
jgi:hypothetical protein